MTLYTLKENYELDSIVEGYASLIWTERYSAFGDTEILFPSTPAVRALLPEGTLLGYSESDRVMRVRTLEDYVDDDGRKLLKVTGPSLEKVMMERVCAKELDTTEDAKWVFLDDAPAAIVRYLFEQICVVGRLSADDIIPLAELYNPYPPDTIPEPGEVDLEIEATTLYDAIKAICDAYEMGFRLVKDPAGGALYFSVYSGRNLTRGQSDDTPVLFSPDLDNLSNVSSLTSTEDYRNVAYVISGFGSVTVQAAGEPDVISGTNRRVLLVTVTETPEFTGTAPEIAAQQTAYLELKGREALAAQKKVLAFDGELGENSKYRHGVDYRLGDLVEMRNADKVVKYMRVTEQIFTEDENGKRSYPTLTDVLLITPGTWLSYGIEWAEAPDTLFWANASD